MESIEAAYISISRYITSHGFHLDWFRCGTAEHPSKTTFRSTNIRGWRAYVNGERRGVQRDSLGLMVIDPACSGACEVWCTTAVRR